MTLPKRIVNAKHMTLLNRLRYSMAVVIVTAIFLTIISGNFFSAIG